MNDLNYVCTYIKFSIIVVCLNPGDKLNQTLDSILQQTYGNYEIIVKDGGSSDKSIQEMRQDKRIRLFAEKDTGIYDAMNQAVTHTEGDYILFLNCGDVFYDEKVLERVAAIMTSQGREVSSLLQAGEPGLDGDEYRTNNLCIFYGDTYSEKNDVLITSSPEITGFTCYRNIPCHQSCFYAAGLCREKPYDRQYKIRADYDHFLWCYYVAGAKMVRMDLTVASYEGGGYSESKENKKRDMEEHRQITRTYMSKGELLRYRTIMALTLAPMRRFLAENKAFSGVYHKLKQSVYRKNQ